MEKLIFVTGNQNKFDTAQSLLGKSGISLEQAKLDISEIQGSSLEDVASDKAKKAFAVLKKPLFINDAGWLITALNGFPGPYMKYINEWFKSEDFINLMRPYRNREVILRDVIVYIDEHGTKTFIQDVKGTMLDEPQGRGTHPSDRVISLSDNGLSISEENDKGVFFIAAEKKVWEEFAEWLGTVRK